MAVARWFLRPPGWRMRVRGEKDAKGETEERNKALGRTRCLVTNEGSSSESYDTLGDGIASRFICLGMAKSPGVERTVSRAARW